jgi:putative transposase
MKPSPSEKIVIIRLVEEAHLPARRTLEVLGIARSSFYRWYERYQHGWPRSFGGPPVSTRPRLEPHPGRGAGTDHREMALDCPELSSRELAVCSRIRGATLCLKLLLVGFSSRRI